MVQFNTSACTRRKARVFLYVSRETSRSVFYLPYKMFLDVDNLQ